ncbi:MAG: nodulation protein NfeD [Betaproteobacteria bacterium]|nr:nodulation protein NfeD [Betaproteobacteria bacterium]
MATPGGGSALARAAGRALCLLAAAFALASGPAHAAPERPVVTLEIKGPIGVATAMQLAAALERARKEDAPLVVVRLDTPGGLVDSTREIIQAVLASPVPVAVYVSPSGARAASAGTYIAYAAHLAAMAPGTHLGAATPVRLGVPGTPGPPGPDPGARDPSKKGAPPSDESTMDRKVLNDAIAYLRGLAQLRGRNAEWAEKAVRDAATLTAEEAVRERVVDFLARDLEDLLNQADGRRVAAAGVERTLATKGAEVIAVEPDWRMRALGVIANPNVAFILMLAGIYGILFEFWNPGAVVPGVIGGISLLLALAAFAVLPVNYAGLALVLLGIAFMTVEAFTPGIGALGVGGVVAFIAGGVFLFDPEGADIAFRVTWPVLIAAASASAAFFLFALGYALRARRRRVVSGAEEMIGMAGRVVAWEGLSGSVHVHGEVWTARAEAPLAPGDPVRVARRDGLTLTVQRSETTGDHHA